MKFEQWIEQTRKFQQKLEDHKRNVRETTNPKYDPSYFHRGKHCPIARYVLNTPEIEKENYLEFAIRWADGMVRGFRERSTNNKLTFSDTNLPPYQCIKCYVEDIEIEEFKCPIKNTVPEMLSVCEALYITQSAQALGIRPEDVNAKGEWVSLLDSIE